MVRSRGYSLIEVVVAMAVFGVFLLILSVLTVDMRSSEKRMPVNFMRHPQIEAVLSRLRRDVLDVHAGEVYKDTHDGYTQGKKTLILRTIQPNGGVRTIVWDFRTEGEVRRIEYNVGNSTEWVARGLPKDFESLKIDAVLIPGRPYGVRVSARDNRGRLAIDQILQPRAHE